MHPPLLAANLHLTREHHASAFAVTTCAMHIERTYIVLTFFQRGSYEFRRLVLVQEELTLVWLLLITTVLTSFFIQRYHVQFIPPSGAAMVLGMICGGIAKAAGATGAMVEAHMCQDFLHLRLA